MNVTENPYAMVVSGAALGFTKISTISDSD